MECQWEMDLPSTDDLIPLTQSLIPPELALAFGINIEFCRTLLDLNMSSYDTFMTKRPEEDNFGDELNLRLFSGRSDMGGSRKLKRGGSHVPNEVNSGLKDDNGDETGSNRAVKRPRLVWTPELHKRFVDVIEHLGINKAVPKTIMEMMNVDGLTRENVASHLQKYRLYLRRVEGGLASESHSTPRRAPTTFDCDEFGSISTPTPMAELPQARSIGSSLPSVPVPVPMPMVGPPHAPYGVGFGQLGLTGFNCGLESGGFGVFWNGQRG